MFLVFLYRTLKREAPPEYQDPATMPRGVGCHGTKLAHPRQQKLEVGHMSKKGMVDISKRLKKISVYKTAFKL